MSGKSISSLLIKTHPITVEEVIKRLSAIDTAALCDADKLLRSKRDHSNTYQALKVMSPNIQLRTNTIQRNNSKLVGISRTVQCTVQNDFLAVLRGLDEAKSGEVLVVDTKGSTKAVAGGLFLTEASRKNLSGLIVDGPIRDMNIVSKSKTMCFSSSITPYSGTVQSLGETQVSIKCGGVDILPGDIIIGDVDGVVAGNLETMAEILDVAEHITLTESKILAKLEEGHDLISLTNYEEHCSKIRAQQSSSLQFKIQGQYE